MSKLEFVDTTYIASRRERVFAALIDAKSKRRVAAAR
jgi:hypothetical protein